MENVLDEEDRYEKVKQAVSEVRVTDGRFTLDGGTQNKKLDSGSGGG